MYIDNIEMESYLENYDGGQHFKLKDLFSKEGREKITEEIKDKHPKVKKALDKHPLLEKAVKTAMVTAAAQGTIAAISAAGAAAYFGAGALGASSAGSLAVLKPAMVANLKAKGKSTNGLDLKKIAQMFMSANGKKSKSAESDFSFISDYFGNIVEKAKRKGASPEDLFINNLIDGTANAIEQKGAEFVNDLITGNDAAKDTPLADPETTEKGTTKDIKGTKTSDDGSKKNLYLVLGVVVLLVIFARR